mgnify:CR=1 FL=1
MDNSTYVPEVTETVQETEEEFDDNVEPLVYEDFQIEDLTEEENRQSVTIMIP